MKTKIISSTILSFFIAASAQSAKQPVMDELLEQPEIHQFSSSGFMECFVDTRLFDVFEQGACFSAANPRTTTAVFRIQGGPASNFRIIWSDNRCSQSSKTCHVPISQYRTITVSADVLNLSNNTFFSVSASASYEGFD